MEAIVRKKYYIVVIGFFLLNNLLQAQNSSIIEKIENKCNDTNIVHYYNNETPNDKNLTFSLNELKINKEQFHLYFFSEVQDTFKLYVDGNLYKSEAINTLPYLGEDGVARINAQFLEIDFPQGQNKFTLKLESTKYGCFETEARKEYPMLYIKYLDKTWYVSHSNVFRLPSAHFMNTTKTF